MNRKPLQVKAQSTPRRAVNVWKVMVFIEAVQCGCETKPPILEWHKIADFDDETKPPILKWDKIADS